MRFKVIGLILLVLALSPAAYLAWSSRDVPHLGYFQDDGLYLIGAKSLAEGSGYRILSLPGQPWQTKYPPLYPLLLSAAWVAAPNFPGNLPWALLVSWLWLPVLLLLCGLYLRDLAFSTTRILVLCALLALNPVPAFLSINLMAEVMFAALLLAVLLLAERAGTAGARPTLALAAGLLAAAAYLTKTAGIPLLLTVTCGLLWRRRILPASLFLAGMMPAVAAWILWSRAHTAASSDLVTLYYTNYLGFYEATISWNDVLALLSTNADTYLRGLGGLILFNVSDGFFVGFFARLFAVVAIAGAVRLARQRGVTQFHLFAIAYSVMLICWNYGPHERFLLPLLPLVWAGFSTEFLNLIAMAVKAFRGPQMDQRIAATVICTGAGAFALLALAASWWGFSNFLPGLVEARRSSLAENRRAFEWISRNTPAGSKFVARQDTLLYLYAHRTGAPLVLSTAPFYHGDREAILRQFKNVAEFGRTHDLSHVFFTNEDYHLDLAPDEREAIRHEFDANPSLHREFSSPRGAVYTVVGQ
ncbi:MAG: hypothetical protein JJE04_06750 [Acidobacteriia bacterium]|nr:hypothetical protein [Terriglobia bacterium]